MLLHRTTLVSYALCSLAFLLSIPYSPYPGSLLVKAMPILILLGVAWVSLQGAARTFVAAALLLSACGDVLLESGLFILGLASFLIAQLCYAWYFFSQRADNTIAYTRLAVIVTIMLTVGITVSSNAGEQMIPVAVYMLAITMMGVAAALYRQPSSLIFAGALVFVCSDSLIGFNRFVTPLPGARYAIMITYYAAQLLILWGVMYAERKPLSA